VTHYIEVVTAARETVGKMLTERTGQRFRLHMTTRGGKTAAVVRQGYDVRMDLPSLPADTILTRTEADRMVAYLVHEVCHCLHTNYSAWNSAVAAGHRVQHWTNALEDVRIEAHERKAGPYKAMRSLISGLVSHLYAEAHTALAAEGKTLGQGMLNAPYIVTVLGRAANGYDLPTTKPLAGQLSPNVRTVVSHALAGLGACRNTWDCLTLAKELVALEQTFKQPQQPQGPTPPPPSNPLGQGQGDDGQGTDQEDGGDDVRQGDDQGNGKADQGDGEEGDTSEEAENDGPCGDGEGDQGQADDDEGDQGGHGEAKEGDDQGEKGEQGPNDGQPGNKSGGTKQPTDDQEEGEPINPDLHLGGTTQEIEQRTGKKADQHDGAHNLNSMTAGRVMGYGQDDKGQSKASLDAMTPPNGVLVGQIGRLLVSEAQIAPTHHETSGRLDRRAITRMRCGAPDVFSRKDTTPAIDTAVLVLVDLSGSMGHRIDLARVTAWALCNAAEAAGGKLAVAGFKGDACDCVLHYVKDWHQTTHQAAYGLRTMSPDSCTPLSASIVAGARDLAEQTATRRILIVLTDGQCDLGAAAVRSACTLAASLGVEAVGIGMACDSVVQAFPPRYSVNVVDMQQLAATGLGTLARMLEEAGAM
jgi:hypothetical protein